METLEKQSEIITKQSETVAKPNVEETKKPIPYIEIIELVDDPFNLK